MILLSQKFGKRTYINLYWPQEFVPGVRSGVTDAAPAASFPRVKTIA